jgi:sugar transferase (PEP-CTERM/EpsH1 system associated)
MNGRASPPLVVHLVHRFDTGGLENGVVNLINRIPAGEFRHAVVALAGVAPAFAQRVQRADTRVIALHKPPGPTLRFFPVLASLFRDLRPDIVHTRNLATLDCQIPAWWTGVPVRIHGEHGRDVGDLDGTNRRHRWNRRVVAPFVHRWVALSRDLASTLTEGVGIAEARVVRICNGVDTARFAPARQGRERVEGSPFDDPRLFVVGTVGRMQAVKNQTALARAFVRLLERRPALRDRLRLVMVGDGPLRAEVVRILAAARCEDLAWLPGERADIAQVMRGLDAFVLPSLAEGISNTVLEAMASGLSVLATQVGGNPDLIDAGNDGLLVPAGDVDALVDGLEALACDDSTSRALGAAARAKVEREFSLEAMVGAYASLYRGLLGTRARRA